MRLAAQFGGQRLRPLHAPVADVDLAGTGLNELLGCKRAHLARADDQHTAAVDATKDLPRQLYGCVADGDRALGNPRLCANPLGSPDGVRENAADDRARGAGREPHRERVFHLAQNLRLAEHERIECAGNAKEVGERVAAAILVGVAGHPLIGQAEALLDETLHSLWLVGQRHKLHPVAGRDDGNLPHRGQRHHLAHEVGERSLGHGEPLPLLHRRALVADAEQAEFAHHRPPPL